MPGNKKHYTLLRQLEMLKCLGSQWTTTKEIQTRLANGGFEIDVRTLQRDLLELQESFPIELNDKGRPFGWRWAKGADIGIGGMSAPEALALRLVELYLRPALPATMLEGFEVLFRRARGKFDALSGGNVLPEWLDKVRSVQPTQPLIPPVVDPETQATISEALMYGRKIKARYKSAGSNKSNEYVLNPLGLILRGPISYLLATAFDYEDRLLYALHRFSSADILEDSVVTPNGFDLDAELEQGIAGFGERKKQIRLKLHCADYLAKMLEETPLARDQKVVLDKDRNVAVVTATVNDTWQLRWWILSQGAAVIVMQPTRIRSEIAEEHRNAAALY